LGDLEARRGAIEWTAACVALARRRPDLRFEFAGRDGHYAPYRDRSVRGQIERFIPADLRARFRFWEGEGGRAEALARARLVACPARSEGFLPECFEAMAAGRPVVVTQALAGSVRPGVTGFVLPEGAPSAAAWADALQAILDRPADELAAVGERAERAMAGRPRDEVEGEALEAFYRQAVARGAVESRRLPACLPSPVRSSRGARRAGKPDAGGTPAPQGAGETPAPQPSGGTPAPQPAGGAPAPQGAGGIAVVVTCYNLGRFLPECLASVRAQTQAPARTVVVDDGSTDPATLAALRRAEADGWRVVRRANGGLVAARNTGIEAVRAAGSEAVRAAGGDEPGAYVFLDADDCLRPRYAEVCGGILDRCPEVGLVSCWAHHFGAANALWARPSPAFPHQWVSNGAATFSAVRAEALREAEGFRPAMERGYEDWDLFNAVLVAGWVGVTAPEVLADYRVREDSMLRSFSAHAHGRMRRLLLERFPDAVARDAVAVALLSEAEGAWGMREELLALRAQAARHHAWRRRPDQAVLWFARRALRRGKGTL
jgi:GT2 family glycosyltransferase